MQTQPRATHVIKAEIEDPLRASRTLNLGRLADTVTVITPMPAAWDQALALVEMGG